MNSKAQSPRLEALAHEAVASEATPAIALGLLTGAEAHLAVAGAANTRWNAPVEPETLFQIGSIAKIYTALLIMQLAEEGRLDIDAPVSKIVPDLVLSDSDAPNQITPRHLMSHTSGMDGDFLMTARTDVARYVDRCAQLPLLFPPGTLWSYSNSGYVLLGRLVEVLTGLSWSDALKDRLFEPLNLKESIADPFQLLRHQPACGHEPDGAGDWRPADGAAFAASIRPAGSFVLQSAGDLLKFAASVLAGLDGDIRLLSGAGWRDMTTIHANLPPHNALTAKGWALGFQVHPDLSLGHAGGVPGAASYLTIFPKARAAHVILVNGQGPRTRDLLRRYRRRLGAMASPDASMDFVEPHGGRSPEDERRIAGTYASVSAHLTVASDPGGAHAVLRYAGTERPISLRLTEIAPLCYATFDRDTGERGANWNFVSGEDDTVEHALVAGRLLPRSSNREA